MSLDYDPQQSQYKTYPHYTSRVIVNTNKVTHLAREMTSPVPISEFHRIPGQLQNRSTKNVPRILPPLLVFMEGTTGWTGSFLAPGYGAANRAPLKVSPVSFQDFVANGGFPESDAGRYTGSTMHGCKVKGRKYPHCNVMNQVLRPVKFMLRWPKAGRKKSITIHLVSVKNPVIQFGNATRECAMKINVDRSEACSTSDRPAAAKRQNSSDTAAMCILKRQTNSCITGGLHARNPKM